ncbi:MAG: Rieske 2Fe-2S domain-containing protein [Gammaproteobacteria bacterium]|nr:Rieske 2Fe-2S domain-containing protein [Gammaproteobacteria bacterium]MYE29372.1 Rieske 2Fe-2S domain-containing protein [Gammaproteobacteria bacterium]MYI02691.1 Rieske 2Fe-2S domain-containing protein [Gammaproteobacteria bacterium]
MQALIAADEVLEGCSKEVEAGDKLFFLVRKDDQLYLYRNICPHLGTPLNWEEDRFLDPDGALIQCSTHGALFRIEDGFCLAGPCMGAHLIAVPFVVVDGIVHIDIGTCRSSSTVPPAIS